MTREDDRPMNAQTAIAIGLAAASTTLTNLAYQREHDAAASLPVLSMRRPLHSLHLLVTSRGWLVGFGMETSGFLLYAAALALASLALVQSIAAGGIGVLAYVGERVSGRRLKPRQLVGVALSVGGLVALGVTLAKSSGQGGQGSIGAVLLWLGGTAALAGITLLIGRRTGAIAISEGVAGGLFFRSATSRPNWRPRAERARLSSSR